MGLTYEFTEENEYSACPQDDSTYDSHTDDGQYQTSSAYNDNHQTDNDRDCHRK